MTTTRPFEHKYLAGALTVFVMLIIAALFIGGETNINAGYSVPTELNRLNQASTRPGFQPNPRVIYFCASPEEATEEVKVAVHRVTGEAARKGCEYEDLVWQDDTWWGIGFAALLAVVVGLLGASGITNDVRTKWWALLIFGLVCAIVGSIVLPGFRNWLDDREVVGELFWRGVIAGTLLFGALPAAYIAQKKAHP